MGIAFFITRLAYYAWVSFYVVRYGVGIVRTLLSFLVLCLHCYWFYGWLRSYWRIRHGGAPSRRASGAKKGDVGVPPVENAAGPTESSQKQDPLSPSPRRIDAHSPVAKPGHGFVPSSRESQIRRTSLAASSTSDCDDVTRLLDDPLPAHPVDTQGSPTPTHQGRRDDL